MSGPLRVAIVGAGPSAMFVAEALVETARLVEIDIIERLPVPFGLVRFGVAPDHPQTKRVSDKYDQILAHPAISYFGNVEVGRDISLGELKKMYHAVVLANGAGRDATLDVSGRELRGVYGAAEFVGWYNGHPDFQDLAPQLDGSAVAIIGLGNVALDIARLLAADEHRLRTTDITDDALRTLSRASIRDIYIIGRRGPLDARFSNPELRELGRLESAIPSVDPSQLPPPDVPGASKIQQRNLTAFWEFSRLEKRPEKKTIHFMFHSAPLCILGSGRVERLRLERKETFNGRATQACHSIDIACGTVISAIGFRSDAIVGAPFDTKRGIVPNENGRVKEGLYVAGWIKRGPSGVIGTNKPDGVIVAQRIVSECTEGPKPGRAGLMEFVRHCGLVAVDAQGWRRIDAAERAAARHGSPRAKFTRIADMLAAVRG